MNPKGFIVLGIYIVVIGAIIAGTNKILEHFMLSIKSFWIGFAVPCFIGFCGGVYVVADNMGYVDKLAKKMQRRKK